MTHLLGDSVLRLPPAAAPGSPGSGDLWQDGTHLYGYINGASRQLTNGLSNVSGAYAATATNLTLTAAHHRVEVTAAATITLPAAVL